jgi:hypothetical protein
MSAAPTMMSAEQLFQAFATRVAELLREHFTMDPEVVLRVRREESTVQALLPGSRRGDAEWFTRRATREQLERNGPNVTAVAWVREYQAAIETLRVSHDR